VDAPTITGFSPIHFAVISLSMPTLKALLAFEPCINCSNWTES